MSTPPTNPDDGPFNIRNGIIPADSALRGAAASRMPVTEEDLPELQRLVDGVNRYNLVYPPNGVPNLGSIIYRPPGYNVTNPVYRFVREKPGIVFLEGFRPWGPQEGPEHLWAGNSTYFNLYRHVNERGPPATPPNFMCVFASTTLSRQWCPPPPTDGGTVFRYEIYAPGGIHVHETLRSHYYFPAQDEVSFLGGIASVFIRSAQEFRITYRNGRRQMNRVNDTLWMNPFFTPQPYLEVFQNYNRLRSPILYYWERGQLRLFRVSFPELPASPT